ncbi:hypothetical protein PspCFBP13508_03400 [Pseudomonas sp. CFBP13508]|nr:hypothetical protein PspCFBP13508_03380 [Pseudomonas sp. CFBP13508]TKJ75109.1 hypothetical protein PspCFBP13508_03390 [Pseudomonas sp. CFBP13508]TKJ75110.1 hypothetical protein PspCFBP13508_03395 [Pseudomonas sp. CFBP13508]TKJ75111.1 hypothetical protein PspCFBP13508_03400 [Pseudomonas sp. CFBP13508]
MSRGSQVELWRLSGRHRWQASSHRDCGCTHQRRSPAHIVGASLLAKAVCQSAFSSTDTPHSRAGSLPQFESG